MPELVNHPQHYQAVSEIGMPILKMLGVTDRMLRLECIDAIEQIEENTISSFSYLNAVKYLWRCGLKNTAAEDLRKANWYLQRWLLSVAPKNPIVERRAQEAVKAILYFLENPCDK